MQYTAKYNSPVGEILLSADETGLTGLWFSDQKYYALGLDKENQPQNTPILQHAKTWLDVYFSGRQPDFKLPLHFMGSEFQNSVWETLCSIPYGRVMTYGEIAAVLARHKGVVRVSAQAVGGAVGHNPISVIVPCHRVVGSNGSLTGYAGGILRKKYLLELEHADMRSLFVPKKGTAL